MDLEELRVKVIPRDHEPLVRLLTQKLETEAQEKSKPKTDQLSIQQLRLLISVNDNPCLNFSDRTKALNWFKSKMVTTKDGLIQQDYLAEETIQPPRGRPNKYLLLTDKGKKYLGDLGEKPLNLHGGLKHHCIILDLKSKYDPNFEASMHYKVGEYFVDLWCTGATNGFVEVIETNHIKDDLKKIIALSSRVDWIHMVMTSQNLRDHYQYTFGRELPESVSKKLQWTLIE